MVFKSYNVSKMGSVGKKFGLVFAMLAMSSLFSPLFLSQPAGAISLPEFELSVAVMEMNSPLQVELFTINSTGSYRAWTLEALNNGFDASWLDDIDNDGNLEFLGLSGDRFLNAYDLTTDQLQWQIELPYTESISYPVLFTADLNGDGFKEIIFSKLSSHSYSTIWNATVIITDYQGNIIQRLYRDDPYFIRFYGADNIWPLPTENGRNALLVSYGNSAYSTTIPSAFDGAYVLERWDWSDTENKLIRTWQSMGPDTGGNTRLITITHEGTTIALTSGWYNNPIRAFNTTDGTLLWERKLLDTKDVDTIQKISDTDITYYDNGQQAFLLAGVNSYSYIFPSKLFALNPLTGEDVLPPREFDRASLTIPNADDKDILVLNRVHPDLNNPDITIWKANKLDPETLEIVKEIRNPDGYFASIVSANRWKNPQNSLALAIGTDAEGKLWLITPNGAFPIGKPIGSIHSAFISTSSIIPGKELIYSFANDSPFDRLLSRFGLAIGLMLALGLLASSFFVSYKYYEHRRTLQGERIFDEYWESIDWKAYFSTQLNRIFGGSSQKESLPIRTSVTEQPASTDKPIFISGSSKGPNDPHIDKGSGQIVHVPPNFPHLRSWINSHTSFAQKIKISDIALMIEVYNVHPDRPTRKDIVAKFKFVPQSTLYGRIKKLEAFGLLRSNQLINQVNDMRYGLLELTEAGKELLQAIHISFNSPSSF